jgi:hypothetical protein
VGWLDIDRLTVRAFAAKYIGFKMDGSVCIKTVTACVRLCVAIGRPVWMIKVTARMSRSATICAIVFSMGLGIE